MSNEPKHEAVMFIHPGKICEKCSGRGWAVNKVDGCQRCQGFGSYKPNSEEK